MPFIGILEEGILILFETLGVGTFTTIGLEPCRTKKLFWSTSNVISLNLVVVELYISVGPKQIIDNGASETRPTAHRNRPTAAAAEQRRNALE